MTASKELLALMALLVALGLHLGWRRRSAPWPTRLAAAMLPLLLGVVVVIYGETVALSTRWVWSACRLAPALGMFHGYPLYTPADSGPINGWLYGPVAALAWTPAALAASPLVALAIAAVFNVLFLLVPLLAAACRTPARPDIAAGVAFVFAATALLQIYPTWYMASSLNADAIAVGLGTGSCLLLLGANPANAKRRWVAAVLGVLAVWTKQTEAFLLPAQFIWLWLVHDRRTALHYAAAYALTMVAATSLVCLLFNPRDLIFNLWTVPSAHSLQGGWQAGLVEFTDFVRYTIIFWAPCALLPFFRPPPEAGNALYPHRKGALLFALVAVCALPLGIVAAIKVGGDRNSMHSAYFLAVAATLTIAGAWPALAARRKGILAVGILLAVLVVTYRASHQVAGYANQGMLPARCLSQEAFSFAREHPGRTYFPWDPLATLLAEGRMHAFEYGVLDRVYAGVRPDVSRVRQDLPPSVDFVIYPRADYPRIILKDYLPEFNQVEATPDWLIYRKGALEGNPLGPSP